MIEFSHELITQFLCYDWRSVGQSVLAPSLHLGLTTRFLLLSNSWGFVDVGRSLWREDGSVVYNCCWRSPAQSFSETSPLGLETIFYCLRFEISLPVASYDSQGYDEGSEPHLYKSITESGRNDERLLPSTVRLLLPLFDAAGTCLSNRCPAMDYFLSSRCSGNVLTEPLSSNGHIRNNVNWSVVGLQSLRNGIPHSAIS
jgi:hypothetical protein